MNMKANEAMNFLEKRAILILFRFQFRIQSKVVVGHLRGYSSTLGAHNEAFLDKERLIDLLERALILADGRSDRVGSHRPTLEGGDDRAEYLVVDGVQSPLVDL